MVLVDGSPQGQVERGDEEKREQAGVSDIEDDRHALDFGVGKGDGKVVDVE